MSGRQHPDSHCEPTVHVAAQVPPFVSTQVNPSQQTVDPAHEPPALEHEPTGANGDAVNTPLCEKHPSVNVKFDVAGAVSTENAVTPFEKPTSKVLPLSEYVAEYGGSVGSSQLHFCGVNVRVEPLTVKVPLSI